MGCLSKHSEERRLHFSQIQHCSLIMQNLERAAVFYREVLGLTEIASPAALQAAGVNVRWFRLGSQQIHLLERTENQSNNQQHLALQVDDAQTARIWMKQNGRNCI